jgi:hypothetical protein
MRTGDQPQNRLAKLMLVLALGALIAMLGIASCKKSKSTGAVSRPIYAGQNDPVDPVRPTPLPSTILLLGSGLAGLGLLDWRKKRHKPQG